MKKILLDASSAILLFKSNLFEQLIEVYQVTMAESVNKELTIDGYPGAKEFANRLAEKRYSLVPADQIPEMHGTLPQVIAGLHRGELQTIRLYENGYADFVITDDGKGAGYCKCHEIPFINALLFPKVLLFSKRLPEDLCRQKMEFLIAAGRYSPEITDWAKSCSKESLDFFLP